MPKAEKTCAPVCRSWALRVVSRALGRSAFSSPSAWWLEAFPKNMCSQLGKSFPKVVSEKENWQHHPEEVSTCVYYFFY